jgi:Flp pilus assembly protein TadB
MAESFEEHQQGNVPPAGEEIHMPASSILPLVNAAALAMAIVSITLSIYLVIFAAIVFLWTTVIWIRDTRRDIAELPLDHRHH